MDAARSRRQPQVPISRRALLRVGARVSGGLAGAALIGCASITSTRSAPTGTPAAGTPTPVPAASGGPRRGGVLRISGQITGDLPGLDYARSGSSTIGSVANLAGVKLTQWDERPDSAGPVENVIPDLAESWETPDQGLTWTFKLRKGARTSDGLEATADDVVWSLNRQANVRDSLGLLQSNMPDLYTRSGARAEVNAKAIDPYTVQFKLPRPDADFLSMTGSHWWTVEHRDVVTKKAAGWGEITGIDQIRGAGPYFPSEHIPATGLRFKRNANFYDASLAHLDGIEHPFVLDPSAAVTALQNDQLDAFGPLSPFSVAQGIELQKSEQLQVN